MCVALADLFDKIMLEHRVETIKFCNRCNLFFSVSNLRYI